MARKKSYNAPDIFESGGGYKHVKRLGSKYGWEYQDGRLREQRGGFDTPEEAAYSVDEWLIAYIGPNAETNQAFGYLKQKQVLAIREKLAKADKPKQRTYNKTKMGASGLKGVYPTNASAKRWVAQITVKNKLVHLGTFEKALDAARAFDLAALRYQGVGAVTNLSLGLIPPVGRDLEFTEPTPPPRKLKPIKAAPVEDYDKQPESNGNNSPIPDYIHSSAFTKEERERETQIIAARSMQDIDEPADGETTRIEPVQPVAVASSAAPVEPVKDPVSTAAAITSNSELIVMSDADKLRARAEAMLREAAEIDAGNIKRQAQDKLSALTFKLGKLQNAMVSLIDHCAEIETEIQDLKELLK